MYYNMLNFLLYITIRSDRKCNHLPISIMTIMMQKQQIEKISWNFAKDGGRANL